MLVHLVAWHWTWNPKHLRNDSWQSLVCKIDEFFHRSSCIYRQLLARLSVGQLLMVVFASLAHQSGTWLAMSLRSRRLIIWKLKILQIKPLKSKEQISSYINKKLIGLLYYYFYTIWIMKSKMRGYNIYWIIIFITHINLR